MWWSSFMSTSSSPPTLSWAVYVPPPGIHQYIDLIQHIQSYWYNKFSFGWFVDYANRIFSHLGQLCLPGGPMSSRTNSNFKTNWQWFNFIRDLSSPTSGVTDNNVIFHTILSNTNSLLYISPEVSICVKSSYSISEPPTISFPSPASACNRSVVAYSLYTSSTVFSGFTPVTSSRSLVGSL